MNGSDVEFVPHMGLSLTIDHSAVDGAPGARFLASLREKLAAFELTLAG
jgi:pyruvate dehydrogenase E2 component (dihydrolipoamide acetyltransferase)